MSIPISELIKFSIAQPTVSRLLNLDSSTLDYYVSMIDTIPQLQRQINTFKEFYDSYDGLLCALVGRIKDDEVSILRENKPLVCSLILEIFERLI